MVVRGVHRSPSETTLWAVDYALLYNPIAGRGRAATVAGAVSDRLRELGHTVREGRSERAGHIREMSRALACDVGRVLVLGGDGSLREAVSGILELDSDERPELGVLPFGSGNVVARELGLPLDPLEAADVIAVSDAVLWDVGLVAADGGAWEPFLAMLGVGFDAAIAERVDRVRRTRWGSRAYRASADLLYVAIGISQLFVPRQPRFSVAVEGEPVVARAVAAVISNTRTYAKGMSLSPGARPDDGLLDLHVRHAASFIAGARAMLAAQFLRESPHWVAQAFDGTSARTTAVGQRPVPWQLDGDAMGRAHSLSVRVDRLAIRLIARRDSSETPRHSR